MVGKSAGTEREVFRGSKGGLPQMVCGKQERSLPGLCGSPVHPRLSCVPPVVGGGFWVLEERLWSMGLGKDQLLAVKSEPKGTGARSATSVEVCRKSPGGTVEARHHC